MPELNAEQKQKRGEILQMMFDNLKKKYSGDEHYALKVLTKKLNDKKFLQYINAMAAASTPISTLSQLKEYIKDIAIEEISATGTSGIGGSLGAEIQTPNAFAGGTARGKAKRKKIANSSGYKVINKQKLFEDVINKVGFDIKFSDQAKELMDYIHSNEKFEDDLQDIQTLFDKMQTDNVFSKEEAFKVYQEFVERAARQYMRDMQKDVSMEEYFLRKDLLDVIYYHLSKLEMPQSGLPNDNIDVPPGEESQGGERPAGETPQGEQPAGGAPAPPIPSGEEGGEGEAPEEETPEEEGPPKPEEISELNNMINEIYREIGESNYDVWKKHPEKSIWFQTVIKQNKKLYGSVTLVNNKYVYFISDKYGNRFAQGEEPTLDAAKRKILDIFNTDNLEIVNK